MGSDNFHNAFFGSLMNSFRRLSFSLLSIAILSEETYRDAEVIIYRYSIVIAACVLSVAHGIGHLVPLNPVQCFQILDV